MDWTSEIRRSFDRAGVHLSDEVAEELAQHAEAARATALAAGAEADDADARVHALIDEWTRRPTAYARRPKNLPAIPPPPAASRGLAGLWMDAAYGARMVRRQPGAALLAAVTMAIAVGATTTLASVAYGVLARPLPWADADRLIRVYESREGSSRRALPILTNAAYHAWTPQAATIEALAGFGSGTVTVGSGEQAQRTQRATATAGLFGILQAVPIHGRLLGQEDDREGANVAVISHRLWQARFGGLPAAVGQAMDIDGRAHTIVGVLPAGFDFPSREVDVWTPMRVAAMRVDPDSHSVSVQMFSAIARLAPGATPAQAAEEATRLVRQGPGLGMVGVAVFGGDGPAVITTRPLTDVIAGDVRPALLMLLAGVGLLFATAIGGLATLQVARWLTRQREMAVRAAIGAGHGRLTRQVLIEQLIVGLAGGALGLGLAWALHRAAPALLPAEFPRLYAIVLDGRIAVLALGLALVATLLTSLLPIVRVRRLPLADALAAGGRTAAEGVFRGVLPRARALVIVAQVAITVVLLVGAGLVTRSFVALGDVDRGYEPDGVLTAQLASAPGRRSGVARRALAEQVVERLEGLPGVRRAAFASALPFMGGATLMGFEMRPDGEAEMRQVQAEVVLVSDGFVDAMGLRLVEGRGFDRRDTATSEAVVVVTRAFAREYLRTKSVGATLPLALGPNQHDVKVIGVVEDLARAVVTDVPPPQALVLASQAGDLSVGDFKIVARTTGDAIALVPALQSVVREVDASAALDSIRPLSDRLASSLAQPRLNALLLGGFAGFALLVAGVGLFGVLSQGVSARRRELGVRLALGATPRRVVTLVVAQGVGLAVAGLAIGITAALLFGGALRALLYGVTTRDPLSFGAVALTVMAVAALACLVPARRAAALDPLQVLRE